MAISPSQYAAKLRRLNRDLESGEIMLLAGGSAIGKMAERIFVRGEDVNGGVRRYDTNDELWVSNTALPKGATGKGKTGKKGNKTTYFSSYAAVIKGIGKDRQNAGVMKFRFANELQSDLLNSEISKDKTGIAKPKLRSTQNNEFVVSLKNSKNVEKANALESRFGVKIFQMSRSEIELVKEVYGKEINKRLQ